MFTQIDNPSREESPNAAPDPIADDAPRRRGRPKGPTAEGRATRDKLYDTARGLIGERGYEQTTLRGIAKAAGVSPGLLYRYFPSKQALVMELYDELSATYAERAAAMRPGKWRSRFQFALEESLATLAPERATLSSLVPVLVGDADEGLFSTRTAFTRERVQAVFEQAVTGASDAPKGATAAALGRILYLAHLGLILFWLLDKSVEQRATRGLIALAKRVLPTLALGLRLRTTRGLIARADEHLCAGLLPNS